MKKGFTLIELLIVVAIIGILAGVGVPMYNGYMAQAKYNATLANFDIVAEQADMLAFECAKDGKNGTLKSFVCKNQNTNSISHLIRDHYHYQGFQNPILGIVLLGGLEPQQVLLLTIKMDIFFLMATQQINVLSRLLLLL